MTLKKGLYVKVWSIRLRLAMWLAGDYWYDPEEWE